VPCDTLLARSARDQTRIDGLDRNEPSGETGNVIGGHDRNILVLLLDP
jgi:hypothetical protein